MQDPKVTQTSGAFVMICRVEVNIRSNSERIWTLLTDAKDFPRWNSTVSSIEGRISEGERLQVRVPGSNRILKPKVSGVRPNESMTWTGGAAPIFKGVRTFNLRLRNDGSTDFVMEERFSGLMLPFIKPSLPDFGPVFASYANDLKRESNKQRPEATQEVLTNDMRLYFARLLAIAFLSTAAAWAQAPESDPAPPADTGKADLGAFVRDAWQMWTSPLRRSTYGSHTVKKYGIPFALLSGALIATDKKTADMLPNTKSQTKWSGRVSQLGASYSMAAFSGGTYLLGRMTDSRHAQETGWFALQAIAHTQVAIFAIKQMTNRERPLSNDGAGGFWEGGDSFPSGHAATSFAVATIFGYEYRDHIAVPITAYALATAISASRLSAQRHWVSDIVVGGSTGFLIGRYVYKHHHDPNLPGSKVQTTQRFIPDIAIQGKAISLGWRF